MRGATSSETGATTNGGFPWEDIERPPKETKGPLHERINLRPCFPDVKEFFFSSRKNTNVARFGHIDRNQRRPLEWNVSSENTKLGDDICTVVHAMGKVISKRTNRNIQRSIGASARDVESKA